MLWKDSTEPGTIPTAAPGAELAPDEQYTVRVISQIKERI